MPALVFRLQAAVLKSESAKAYTPVPRLIAHTSPRSYDNTTL